MKKNSEDVYCFGSFETLDLTGGGKAFKYRNPKLNIECGVQDHELLKKGASIYWGIIRAVISEISEKEGVFNITADIILDENSKKELDVIIYE